MGKKGPWSQGLQYRRHHSPTWSLLCLQMAQELGISEKSPDYRNPFKTDHSEVRWQHCWHILWGSTSTLWLQAAGWAGEGNGWLGGEQPKTPSMEEAYPKHVRQIPQLGCGWFWVPCAICPLLWPPVPWEHRVPIYLVLHPTSSLLALQDWHGGLSGFGGLLPLGDRRELPMLTPHCHFAVFP